MRYDLILVIKHRRSVIDEIISERLRSMFEQFQHKYNIELQEWFYSPDYIHVSFRGHPNSELSKFINTYKSASSRIIKRDFPEIKPKLWQDTFWSRSFCLLTAGDMTDDVIATYVASQN